MAPLAGLLLLAAAVCSEASLGTRHRRVPFARTPARPADDAVAEHHLPSGALWNWGIGGPRLARSDARAPVDVPAEALLGRKVRAVAASGHTVAVLSDGTVVSFGRNNSAGGGGQGSRPIDDSGQLGRGESFPEWRDKFPRSEGPGYVHLNGRLPAVGVAAGRYHSAAVDAAGAVYTWGLNDHGQLGRQGVADTAEGARPKDGFAFGEAIRTLHGDGRGDGVPCVLGFGCRSGNPAPAALPDGFHATGISAGRYTTVAWDGEGQAYVWGHDNCAGHVTDADAHVPRALPPPPTAPGDGYAKIDSGYSHWVALTTGGAVVACHTGFDGYGSELSRDQQQQAVVWRAVGAAAPGPDAFVPRRIPDLERCVDVAAGRGHSWAACGGTSYFWGHLPTRVACMPAAGDRANDGNLVHETSEPRSPDLSSSTHAPVITMVAAGEYFALLYDDANRRVLSLGANGVGQGGDGSAPQPSKATPVAGELGAGGLTVRALAAGYQHAAAIVRDANGAAL